MIQLSNDCLVFQLSDGEAIPCSVEHFTLELVGDHAGDIDPDVIRNAAQAVLHYFRDEMQRTFVSLGEFTEALERVLMSFGFTVSAAPVPGKPVLSQPSQPGDSGADLGRLADDSDAPWEMLFFNQLRSTLRDQLAADTRCVQFRGLRRCAKRLVGARRWCPRSERMSDQIVGFLRECLNADAAGRNCGLVVS